MSFLKKKFCKINWGNLERKKTFIRVFRAPLHLLYFSRPPYTCFNFETPLTLWVKTPSTPPTISRPPTFLMKYIISILGGFQIGGVQ